jgi:hypothetical protein
MKDPRMGRLTAIVATGLLVGACGGGGAVATSGGDAASATTGQPSVVASDGGTGGGAAASALAAASKNACSLMPVAAVQAILPKAAAPAPEPEPFKCSMSDGTSVVEISVDANPLTSLETLNPCEPISGLGVSACLQEQRADDAYLQVQVTSDPVSILYVEVAGNDQKAHRDDAISVAKAILAKLG